MPSLAITWAQCLKRVFHIDIETCSECGLPTGRNPSQKYARRGSFHSCVRVLGRFAPPTAQEVDALSDQVMAMVRPAFGLEHGRAADEPDPDLRGIARRLELAVSRLERSGPPRSRSPDP